MAAALSTTPARPRSRPTLWRAARSRRRTRLGHDPLTRPARGRPGTWTRIRRFIWAWWPWAIATVVLAAADEFLWTAVTAAIAAIAHLSQPRAESPRFGLDHEIAADSPEFVATMEGATGVSHVAGNSVEVLANGDRFYPRMLDDIATARASICIEAYIYWAGAVGAEFAAALAERARDGVRVLVLLDAVGASDIGDDSLEALRAGGCTVAWYNPLHWKTLGRINNRTHRKSLIVDGEVAYTGGAGIADHWRGDARGPGEWRDTQIRFAGPAARGLQTGFARNWQETTGELISGGEFYPVVSARGPLSVQVVLSSPEQGGSSVQTMYFLGIVCARRSIFIANPYFVPDAAAVEALLEARRRGVDVRVMVSGVRNDNWLARHNSIRHYGRLLRGGVVILEYNRSMLHHKIMVVDGVWTTIGTTNFDSRSFAHNEESNLCVHDRELAGQMERLFIADIDACAVVTLDAWRRRGVTQRAREAAASFFEDQV